VVANKKLINYFQCLVLRANKLIFQSARAEQTLRNAIRGSFAADFHNKQQAAATTTLLTDYSKWNWNGNGWCENFNCFS